MYTAQEAALAESDDVTNTDDGKIIISIFTFYVKQKRCIYIY
jgi:hypothetical protein